MNEIKFEDRQDNTLVAYTNYIERNLPRIRGEGWTPLGFEDFSLNEELVDAYIGDYDPTVIILPPEDGIVILTEDDFQAFGPKLEDDEAIDPNSVSGRTMVLSYLLTNDELYASVVESLLAKAEALDEGDGE